MNIPAQHAEVQVLSWEAIDRANRDSLSQGRRYDAYAGHVAHSQCIPRDLLEYRADPRQAVEKADLEFFGSKTIFSGSIR